MTKTKHTGRWDRAIVRHFSYEILFPIDGVLPVAHAAAEATEAAAAAAANGLS
jgi:hypothetical protein